MTSHDTRHDPAADRLAQIEQLYEYPGYNAHEIVAATPALLAFARDELAVANRTEPACAAKSGKFAGAVRSGRAQHATPPPATSEVSSDADPRGSR